MTKPTLDRSDAARQRRAAVIDAALASCALTGSARATERRKIEVEIEAEEVRQAAAAAARAEATAERQRIRAAYRIGLDRGRPLQALRLALSAPLPASAVEMALSSTPLDTAATDAAKIMPGAENFGSAAAQAERDRIRRAFALPEAQGRTKATAAFVLEGDGGLTADQVSGLLAGMPVEATLVRQSLAERSAAAGDFGADHGADSRHSGVASRSSSIWKKAVGEANRSLGAVPSGEADAAQERARMSALRAQVDAGEAEAARFAGRAAGRIE